MPNSPHSIIAALALASTLATQAMPARAEEADEVNLLIKALAPIAEQVDASASVSADIGDATVYLMPEASIDIEVYFARNSTVLDARARQELSALGAALSSPELAPYRYLVAGHTDASGSAAFNQQLSEQRADSVRAFLIEDFVIDPGRLESVGWGETRLKDPDNPRAAINRRVEVTLIVPPEGFAAPEAQNDDPATGALPQPQADDPSTDVLPGTLITEDDGSITIAF